MTSLKGVPHAHRHSARVSRDTVQCMQWFKRLIVPWIPWQQASSSSEGLQPRRPAQESAQYHVLAYRVCFAPRLLVVSHTVDEHSILQDCLCTEDGTTCHEDCMCTEDGTTCHGINNLMSNALPACSGLRINRQRLGLAAMHPAKKGRCCMHLKGRG